jgi:hypothetical protein
MFWNSPHRETPQKTFSVIKKIGCRFFGKNFSTRFFKKDLAGPGGEEAEPGRAADATTGGT